MDMTTVLQMAKISIHQKKDIKSTEAPIPGTEGCEFLRAGKAKCMETYTGNTGASVFVMNT